MYFDQDSRKRMQAGINKLADAVGVTLGPRGSTAFIVTAKDKLVLGFSVNCCSASGPSGSTVSLQAAMLY